MASGIPDDGKPPCFHMMHAGKPLSSHGYPRPFDETFHGKPFRIYAQKVGLYSYNPAQISSSLIRYTELLRNLDPSPESIQWNRYMQRQRQGLRQWKRLESGKYEHLGVEKLLDAYAKCIDDLFFGGLLKGFYKIGFMDSSVMRGVYGWCSHGRKFEHGFEIEIKISNCRGLGSFEIMNRPSQLREYLNTLIHEMIHALFQLYCCESCPGCIAKNEAGVGTSGHIMSWQSLAISIEDVLNECPDFIGAMPFDLGRSTSFSLEFNGDEDFCCNSSLQETLTKHQLTKLRLSSWTYLEILERIEGRDVKRAATRRKEAAARRKELKQKKAVLGGRISKPDWPYSRH